MGVERTLRLGVWLAVLLVCGGREAWGQTKTGTTIGGFLLVEPSARLAAMGNAGVATFDEVTTAYYNPASLGHRARSGVEFTHTQWLAGIDYNYATAAVRVGAHNTILMSVTALTSGEIDVRTVEQETGTGERYSVRDLAFGIGYSRRVTDRFSAGFQVKYVQETIWHSRLSAAAVDFGVLYELPFRAYIGASLSNFGTRGSFDGRDLRVRYDQDPDRYGDNSSLPAALETEAYPLPILFRVGLGVPVAMGARNEVKVVVDAYQPSFNTESVSLGAEWTFMELVSLRGGYQNLFQEDSEMGLTLGAGLQYDLSSYGFRFDYAWAGHDHLGDMHRFMVGFAF